MDLGFRLLDELHPRPPLPAQGVHPRVVMETLGHGQMALTMKTYHVLPPLQREAALRMDEVLAR